MNPSNKDDHERNKETQAFDPSLVCEERIEHSVPGAEEKQNPVKRTTVEVEEDKEKTAVATKEAMLRVGSGLV